eukprot:scaffold566_cov115-Isochrysis_galbana.AAC.7
MAVRIFGRTSRSLRRASLATSCSTVPTGSPNAFRTYCTLALGVSTSSSSDKPCSPGTPWPPGSVAGRFPRGRGGWWRAS